MSMREIRKYRNGELIQCNDPLPDWEDGEDFEVVLKRNGYRSSINTIGDLDFNSIVFYQHKDEHYLIDVTIGSNCRFVLVDDFYELMLFFRDFAPAFAVWDIFERMKTVEIILTRGFHALHGHHYDDVCRECDLDEYRRRQEAWKRRQQPPASAGN